MRAEKERGLPESRTWIMTGEPTMKSIYLLFGHTGDQVTNHARDFPRIALGGVDLISVCKWKDTAIFVRGCLCSLLKNSKEFFDDSLLAKLEDAR
jgi:hypothetical protein